MENITRSTFIALCFLSATLIRWCISLGPYSGMNKPPLFGDYEAQRHWQEITIHTPTTEWYENTTNNNLMYWGLDYPPLTAYHSYINGRIASRIDANWTALHKSHGIESYEHKLFMRYTVLMVDLLVFFPAVYLLFNTTAKSREAFLTALIYPGLILIDYGHFQYNNFSLGLFMLAVYHLQSDRNLLGAIFYCLALNYKQMELYHSLPFFCYLLGVSLRSGIFTCFIQVGKLGIVVVGTFIACWWPFLQNKETALSVLNRLFPIGRGLYEDKVANFWCSLSPVLKLKQLMTPEQIIQMCATTTLLAALPSALHLLFSPSVKAFKLSCVNISLAFFLFSFQVHEKSILIPAISACLVYTEAPFIVTWFLYTSTFSMVPLLQKDGLLFQYNVTKLFFLIVLLSVCQNARTPGPTLIKFLKSLTLNMFSTTSLRRIMHFCFYCSIIMMEVMTLLHQFYNPPSNLPDLWPVCISTFSCAMFLFYFLFFNFCQIRCCNTSKPKIN